jgi:hypothetical protein
MLECTLPHVLVLRGRDGPGLPTTSLRRFPALVRLWRVLKHPYDIVCVEVDAHGGILKA